MAPRDRRDVEERERGEPHRPGALDSDDIAWLKRLADSAPALVRLAEHADDIIGSAEDRKWWKGLKRRGRTILVWVGSIIGAAVAALTFFDRIKPPGTGGH